MQTRSSQRMRPSPAMTDFQAIPGLVSVQGSSPDDLPAYVIYAPSPKRKTISRDNLSTTPPSPTRSIARSHTSSVRSQAPPIPRLPPMAMRMQDPASPTSSIKTRISFHTNTANNNTSKSRQKAKPNMAKQLPPILRDSAYYAAIPANRSHRAVTQQEQEFGWAGSARHFRKSRVAGPSKLNTSATPFRPPPLPQSPTSDDSADSPDASLEEAMYKMDLKAQQHGDLSQLPEFVDGDERMPAWWMRLMRKVMRNSNRKDRKDKLRDRSPSDSSLSSTSSYSSSGSDGLELKEDDFTRPVDTAELHAFREVRDRFLKQRQYRGSIFYDEITGIAKIPLYAAPKSANMVAAPALSSFAPIAPLGQRTQDANRISYFPNASIQDRKAQAQAIATVNIDGGIMEIRKNKRQSIFVRADAPMRFSRFLDIEGSEDKSSGYAY